MTNNQAPSLRELQQLLRAAIRPAAGPDAVAAPAEVLNPQRETPGTERLAVYAGGYLARTREALEEVYEAVRHLVGERAFAELAAAYATRHASHDYNLSLAGRHLPAFLAASALAESLPFLPDLARLEWLVCEAFHAFDAPPLHPSTVASRSLEAWMETTLVFQSSVKVLASPWPILDLWAARAQPRESVNLELVNRAQRVLVFRQDVQTRCELIDARQHALLAELLAGRTLGEACGILAGVGTDAPLPLAAWFARWAGQGLLATVTARVAPAERL